MNFNTSRILRGAMLLTMLSLTACGGGGSAAIPDTTAPTTTVAPAVSGTTDTATTLSVTIDENGIGYYLVQPTAAAAPTVADVQTTGTPFSLTANVAATPAISGLVSNTAYTIYFVAKDAANNVQAAVGSVAVTTSYLVQGGLTWMPVTFTDSWANANAYCANTTINGLTGWRQPTQAELSALYTSGLMSGQGWLMPMGGTWSSTLYSAGNYYFVSLDAGLVGWGSNFITPVPAVSCVRNNANVPPVAAAGSAQNVVPGTLVTLDGSASSDANIDPLTYSWTLTSKPAGSTATLSGATTSSPTFTPDLAGDYIATLVVNDGTLDSAAATVTIGAGYVSQGGLTWMPVTFYNTWANANAYCTNTALDGVTGWRMPTQTELSALSASGAMSGQGWTLGFTWSSTPNSGNHSIVNLSGGFIDWGSDTSGFYVSCVR